MSSHQMMDEIDDVVRVCCNMVDTSRRLGVDKIVFSVNLFARYPEVRSILERRYNCHILYSGCYGVSHYYLY